MACVLRPMIRAMHPNKGKSRPGRICESVVCPPGGTQIELACHVDVWGVPYNAPLLTWRFCPGRMGGLKMILLKLLLLFGFSVPRGVAEAKKRKSIYGKLPLLGIPRRHVVSIAARLGVWNTEELSPFK